jgi:hypothetical protein
MGLHQPLAGMSTKVFHVLYFIFRPQSTLLLINLQTKIRTAIYFTIPLTLPVARKFKQCAYQPLGKGL